MSPLIRNALPLLVVFSLLVPVGVYLAMRRVPPSAPVKTERVHPVLSVLGEMPDWSKLAAYHGTISRGDFEHLLATIFTTSESWRGYIETDDQGARIATGMEAPDDIFHLRFATDDVVQQASRHWKKTSELPPAPQDLPLSGLHIAIDPGHIGGAWAKIEERWLLIGGGPPIIEGDMTLQVANLLKPELEKLGAKVTLVREGPEPVTPLRPESLMAQAVDSPEAPDSPEGLRRLAERLFYRTAEIRSRGKLVNETIRPDLVLCLHFNADPWGDPANPTLVERTHLHLLLNGAYTDDEVAFADQRFAMLDKLLSRTHEEEALVGMTVADVFAARSGLPPFTYPEGGRNVRPVNGHPYLWARNLLANRLYDCPVIFMEPYVMNSTIDYPRLQAGDYEGVRSINGTPRESIFREYAGALAAGLAKHYSSHRQAAR